MKTKKFDCVEMKNEIQARLYEDYIANKEKYPSYVRFIEERAKESAWAQQMTRRFQRADAHNR